MYKHGLDLSQAKSLGEEIASQLIDTGYETEALIPVLVQAIVILADEDDQLLDAAANLLADGGV